MRTLGVLLVLAGMAGCATTPIAFNTNEPDPALLRLAQAAETQNRYNAAYVEMVASVYRKNHPDAETSLDISSNPELTELLQLGDEWIGPVYPLAKEVSTWIGWNEPLELNVRPPNDVLVSVRTGYRRAIDILQDAGVQAGSLAMVRLDLENKRVVIEYAD